MKFWLKSSSSIVGTISIPTPRFGKLLCLGRSSQVGREEEGDGGPMESFSTILSTCNVELLLTGMLAYSIYKKHSHDFIQV